MATEHSDVMVRTHVYIYIVCVCVCVCVSPQKNKVFEVCKLSSLISKLIETTKLQSKCF